MFLSNFLSCFLSDNKDEPIPFLTDTYLLTHGLIYVILGQHV